MKNIPIHPSAPQAIDEPNESVSSSIFRKVMKAMVNCKINVVIGTIPKSCHKGASYADNIIIFVIVMITK